MPICIKLWRTNSVSHGDSYDVRSWTVYYFTWNWLNLAVRANGGKTKLCQRLMDGESGTSFIKELVNEQQSVLGLEVEEYESAGFVIFSQMFFQINSMILAHFTKNF